MTQHQKIEKKSKFLKKNYIYITCWSKPFFLLARFCKKVNPEIRKPNDFGGF
jgi:hypothetical protein